MIKTEDDKNKRAVKKYAYDSAGKESSYWTLEHDAKGRVSKQSVYEKNELIKYTIWEYGEDDTEERILFYSALGILQGYNVHKLDDEGRVEKTLYYDSSGNLKQYVIYERNKNEDFIETWYDSEGRIKYKMQRESE